MFALALPGPLRTPLCGAGGRGECWASNTGQHGRPRRRGPRAGRRGEWSALLTEPYRPAGHRAHGLSAMLSTQSGGLLGDVGTQHPHPKGSNALAGSCSESVAWGCLCPGEGWRPHLCPPQTLSEGGQGIGDRVLSTALGHTYLGLEAVTYLFRWPSYTIGAVCPHGSAAERPPAGPSPRPQEGHGGVEDAGPAAPSARLALGCGACPC